MIIDEKRLAWERLRHVLIVTGFKGDEELPIGKLTSHEVPRWPSGIEDIEERAGGLYGLSVVAGKRKLGKSMLALGSAIRAAQDGWRVFYFDAENAYWIVRERVINFFAAPERSWPGWFPDQFEYRPLGRSARMITVAKYVADHIMECDDRVLVVLDSVNRIAKRLAVRSKNPHSYFTHLNEVVDWGATITKETHGKIGVLLVSEMTRKGDGAIGLDIEYAADCLVFLTKGSEENRVQLDFESRGTPGGDLGDYRRVYTRCGFTKPGLKLVDDPEDDRVRTLDLDLAKWVDGKSEDSDPDEELGF